VRVSDIRDYNGDGEEDILYLSGFSGAVGVGRVRIVSRLGVTLLDTTLTGATGSTSIFSTISDVTGDGRGEWLAGIVNGNAAISEGQLWARGLTLPTKSLTGAGFSATFAVDLGLSNGGRLWIQAYGISGSVPGTNLGGGTPLIPLNFDVITDYVFTLAGTPAFPDIVGVLSPAGTGAPTLFLPPPVVTLLTGIQLRTAVAAFDVGTGTLTAVSNCVIVSIP
jgi:hypothetical protein